MYKKFYEFCRNNIYIYRIYLMIWSIKNLILYGHFAGRPFVVDSEKRVIYLKNAKVACSSIKAAMYPGNTKDDDSVHGIVRSSGMYKEKLTPEESEYFKFTYVRNPFERLVSCYESKYHADKKYSTHKILYFDFYLFGYLRKDRGFDNFVRRVVRIPNRFMDAHFRCQYDLIYDSKGRKLVDHIGQYENMAEDFKQIQEKYGLKELPRYNSSGGEKRDWRSYYTLETAELVYEKYKKDFECFGYEDSYKDLMAYLKDRENK